MIVKIVTTNINGSVNTPPGKLGEAEIHFTDGPLAGTKLIGFVIWERRGGKGQHNVTFPARTYQINGERRSFALLRPSGDDASGQENVRALILKAYQDFEESCETEGHQPGTVTA